MDAAGNSRRSWAAIKQLNAACGGAFLEIEHVRGDPAL